MDLSQIFQVLQQADQVAAQESPYRPLEEAGAGISNAVLQSSVGAKPGEAAIAGLLSGLLSGGASNLTNRYRAEQSGLARDALVSAMSGGATVRPSRLNPSVFAPVRDAGSLFSAMRQLDKADLQDKYDIETGSLLKREIAKAAINNPEALPQMMQALESLETGVAPSAPIAEPIAQAPSEDPLGLGAPYRDRFNQAMKEARAKGLTGNASLEYAQTLLKPDALANAQAEKTITALREKINALDSITATAEAGVAGAGETGGFGGGIRNQLSRFSAAMGSEDQTNKQTAQSMLDTTGPEVIKAFRTAGVGSMSDREELRYVGAGPSSDKTPEANRAIIEKMRAVADLDREYLNFLEQAQATYGTTKGTDKIWQEYKAAQPPFIQVGTEFVPNTNRVPFQQWLENPQASNSPADMPGGQPTSSPIATRGAPSREDAIAELQRRGLM